MAPPVFSKRFLSEQGVSSSSAIVTVPAGRIYVVKQLTFYANPFFEPSRGYFRDLDSGCALFSCGTQTGTPAWFGFYGELVFTEGQSFQWHVTVGGTDACDVSAHGYDFSAAGGP